MAGRCASRRALALLRDHADRVARSGPPTAGDRARAQRLRVLITPPTVVIAGASNVGKSTLTNALARRTVSVTDDAAGTTRDPVPVRLDLDGVTVDWIDLPGLLEAPSGIDASAASIASRLAASARVMVLATAPGRGWPAIAPTDGTVLVRVLLQADRPEAATCIERHQALVACSARQATGLDDLALAVRRALVSDDDLEDPRAWVFDDAHR
jgi:tRNA U34 5-carboxymethylaminomethyl modifying GTPase MnmE/TrmE